MKVSDVMTKDVVKISPGESVDVAARMLTHYNIGALPVCTAGGKLCGVVTDRDLVTRCLAADKLAASTQVRQIMTNTVLSVTPAAEISEAAKIMGSRQIRRLPVVENGKLCGMVSLKDLTENQVLSADAMQVFSKITAGVRRD